MAPACERDDLVLHRMGKLEDGIAEIRDELRALVRLQTEMVEIQRKQNDLETRVRQVEAEMPTLVQARVWLFGGIGTVIAGVGTAVASLLRSMP